MRTDTDAKYGNRAASRRLRRYDFSRSSTLAFVMILGVLLVSGFAVGVAAMMWMR
jgi:hypothetical protein